MLVEQAIAGCDTGQTEGLNIQILERLIGQDKLVKIDHPLIVCEGRQNNPYLQPEAYNFLVRAVESRGEKMFINSCLRTVVQQYMLWMQKNKSICNIRAAAVPGRSNHQSGKAIDIQDAYSWKLLLGTFKWRWIGAFDPMHFDFVGGGTENLGALQTLEFQKLWNEHNPQERIAEDGIWGQNTASKVAKSPIGGFGLFHVLKKGDFSQAVGDLQLLLRKALNYSPEQLAADCHFGSATFRALMLFQTQNQLNATGEADKATMDKLNLVVA